MEVYDFSNTENANIVKLTNYIAIRVDKENRLLFAYDIENSFINYSSVGILSSVNRELASQIKESLEVDMREYGVDLCEESTPEDVYNECL